MSAALAPAFFERLPFDLAAADFFFLLLFGAIGMTSMISSSSMGSPGPAHSGSLPMACLDSLDSEAHMIP